MWKDKYKNQKNDNAELESQLDRQNKDNKTSGSATNAEIINMRSKINELEAERDEHLIKIKELNDSKSKL